MRIYPSDSRATGRVIIEVRANQERPARAEEGIVELRQRIGPLKIDLPLLRRGIASCSRSEVSSCGEPKTMAQIAPCRPLHKAVEVERIQVRPAARRESLAIVGESASHRAARAEPPLTALIADAAPHLHFDNANPVVETGIEIAEIVGGHPEETHGMTSDRTETQVIPAGPLDTGRRAVAAFQIERIEGLAEIGCPQKHRILGPQEEVDVLHPIVRAPAGALGD